MLEVVDIEPGSIAEELGIERGDRLLKVNDEVVNDFLDYLLEESREELCIELERADGELWELEIEHDSDEPLGIELQHPDPRQCGNNCLFCFVHQLPRGMRKTLYVKDEDYRFSYLYGAYVTLTNVSEEDLQRIIKKQLSPLYVSVHATDNELRQHLLGKRAPEILPLLRRLVENGIDVHTQVVVCPEINDGEHLEKTCADLVSLGPRIKSLAIVPVGLTGHRKGLFELRPHSPEEAKTLVDWVELTQTALLPRLGTRFVFAADELYLKAGAPFPPLETYEDLSQVENGVGLVPVFRKQVEEVLENAERLKLPPISLVTGVSASSEIQAFAEALSQKCRIDLRVHVVKNNFFSGHVTVAGLLTGTDLLGQLPGEDLGRVLLVPEVMLREGEDVFLDNVKVNDLAETLNVEVEIVPATPWGVLDMLETLATENWPETGAGTGEKQ